MKTSVLLVLVYGRDNLDAEYLIPVGPGSWDPLSRRDLSRVYPLGIELLQPIPTGNYLKRGQPYIAPDLPRDGFILDCETAFAYDLCPDIHRRVCDAFCVSKCKTYCGDIDFGSAVKETTKEIIECLNNHKLNNCAYQYGVVQRLPVSNICQKLIPQVVRGDGTTIATKTSEVVAISVDWNKHKSHNYKSIRKAILELKVQFTNVTDTDFLFDGDAPLDTSNLIKLVPSWINCDNINSANIPFAWSQIESLRWQRSNLFGVPYYLDEGIYQIDVTHLYNHNVWNSIGTESTLLVWFNHEQPNVKFSNAEESSLIVYSDFSSEKIIAKSDIKNTRILTGVATFNDRIDEF